MKQLTAAERKLLEPIDPGVMLTQTLQWCEINSFTRNDSGLSAQLDALSKVFADLPGDLSVHEPSPLSEVDAQGRTVDLHHGRSLVVRVRPKAERRFLLTGHMDTVYPPDHPFASARWIDDDTLNAPGAADMKGGLAVMLSALHAFERREGAGTVGYDVLINADEEAGSLGSAALIADLARGKAAALTYEPSARPDGTLAHARGGSGNFSVMVRGRSAHAGRNPEEGRNAIVAAGAIAVALHGLQTNRLAVNPARIDGGSANNVVPDLAIVRFNIRPADAEAANQFSPRLKDLLAEVEERHEVVTTVTGGITRPPKAVDAAAQRLFELVQRSGADLGESIGVVPSGGVCDGNNIAAAGVPIVDTMGVRGGAIHSPDEYLIVSSLAERAALSALVLHRLAMGAAA